MKFNLPQSRTVNMTVNIFVILLALLFVFFIVSIFFPFTIKSGPSTFNIDLNGSFTSATYSIDNSLEPIDDLISDTLPHKKYRKLTDSVRQRRNMKNGMLTGSSAQAMFIGGLTLERCENCSMSDDDRLKTKEHFIKLNWWTLDTVGRPEPIKYYVKDGKPYLRKTICELKQASRENHKVYNCKEVDVAIPFRYDVRTKSLLIPASNHIVNVLNIVCLVFMVLLFLFFLYFIVGGFIKFLLEIARGTPFSEGNVLRLKIIALSFLWIPLGVFLLNLLMRLIFYKYFTDDIKLSADAWAVFWKPAVLSVIFAALYFAFKKGKELKDEQDLTV
ncbi:DUF2975 domain-containing protein [Pedobacter nyackensis]|uniref:DUF2975 domain-containing protein n=1 Tax=Pedobacter nyackensis TaxID=475255 RepID=UPI00292E0938|nr:DUF2975 domain-containing protein [Pedobacter nyackensis]